MDLLSSLSLIGETLIFECCSYRDALQKWVGGVCISWTRTAGLNHDHVAICDQAKVNL